MHCVHAKPPLPDKKITFNKVNLKSFFQMMRNEILQKSGWTPAPPEPICCGKNG